MAPDDPEGRARRVQENAIEYPSVPPSARASRVSRLELRMQIAAQEILFHSPEALWVDVDAHQMGEFGLTFRHQGGLAPRRCARIEYALTRAEFQGKGYALRPEA